MVVWQIIGDRIGHDDCGAARRPAMFTPRKMTGRCANGAERDKGSRFHAVPEGTGWQKAVCGAKPGVRGNGWSDYAGDKVTCPRCAFVLAWREPARHSDQPS